MPYKTLIADDHEVIINGLTAMLNADAPIFDCEKATTIESLYAKLSAYTQLLILDLNMGKHNTIKHIPELLKNYPSLKIIVFTSYNSPSLRREAANAGAHGFLTKDASKQELLKTIAAALETDQAQKIISTPNELEDNKLHDKFSIEEKLSGRELEVLKMVALGNTSQQIAETLCISKHTVQWHRKNVLSKLDLHSAGEMIRFAYENGLV